jgi:hypothetical protein
VTTAFELIVAGLFALGGIRSIVVWSRRQFESPAIRDQVLYAANVTGRIALWFAFAGAFLGFAFLDEPQRFRWYVFVLLGLALLQFVTAYLLGRSAD